MVAHSMGNLGFLRALERISQRMESRGLKFGQIFLAAPDTRPAGRCAHYEGLPREPTASCGSSRTRELRSMSETAVATPRSSLLRERARASLAGRDSRSTRVPRIYYANSRPIRPGSPPIGNQLMNPEQLADLGLQPTMVFVPGIRRVGFIHNRLARRRVADRQDQALRPRGPTGPSDPSLFIEREIQPILGQRIRGSRPPDLPGRGARSRRWCMNPRACGLQRPALS